MSRGAVDGMGPRAIRVCRVGRWAWWVRPGSGIGQLVGIGSTMEADLGSIGLVRRPPPEFESFGSVEDWPLVRPKGIRDDSGKQTAHSKVLDDRRAAARKRVSRGDLLYERTLKLPRASVDVSRTPRPRTYRLEPVGKSLQVRPLDIPGEWKV